MAENLTRYELGILKQMHDDQHYKQVDKEDLARQLRRLGLPPRVSRFELSERIREIESEY